MPVQIITHSKAQIVNKIAKKQNGKCIKCKQPITKEDDIVSRYIGHSKYYHEECARRLKII